MPKPHTYTLILLLSLYLHPAALHAADDKDYKSLIVGTWAEVVDKSGNIYFYDTYFPDGRVHGYGYSDINNPESYFFADGTWEIVDGMSCIAISFSSSKFLKPGEYKCDKIVKLNDEVFVYQSDGNDVTMRRVSNGRVDSSRFQVLQRIRSEMRLSH